MKKQAKVWCIFMLLVLVSSYVSAYQEPIPQGADSSQQLVIGGQDVITASDAGGGYLSSRDLILIIALGVGILVLVAIL